MSNLTKEAIEAITAHEESYYQDYGVNRNTKIRSTFMVGAAQALTNPTIYQAAGLMTVEEALEFAEWVDENGVRLDNGKWVTRDENDYNEYTTTDLLTIFRQQKEVK
jgi:hypothetical protein